MGHVPSFYSRPYLPSCYTSTSFLGRHPHPLWSFSKIKSPPPPLNLAVGCMMLCHLHNIKICENYIVYWNNHHNFHILYENLHMSLNSILDKKLSRVVYMILCTGSEKKACITRFVFGCIKICFRENLVFCVLVL